MMRIDRWGSVPSPWYVFYEFVRQMSAGFAITLGPHRTSVVRAPKISFSVITTFTSPTISRRDL
jgi:hypothetical protein